MIKKTVIFLAIFIIANFAYSVNYPDWFIHQGDYDIVVAYRYENTDIFKDASITYSMCRKCVVKGTLYLFPDIEKRDSDYYFYFDEDTAKSVMNKFTYVKGHILKSYPLSLIAALSLNDNTELENKIIDLGKIKEPQWINENAYEKGNYVYGVGYYTSRGNSVDAWKTAERRSVFSILSFYLTIQHGVKMYYRESDTDQLSTYQALSLNHTLEGIEFIERWHDVENNVVYVLSCVKKDNIYSPFVSN